MLHQSWLTAAPVSRVDGKSSRICSLRINCQIKHNARIGVNNHMTVKPIPDGYHSVTPYLGINGAAEAIEANEACVRRVCNNVAAAVEAKTEVTPEQQYIHDIDYFHLKSR